MNENLTAERLRELLEYFPDTGEWRWRVDRWRAKAGDSAGSKRPEDGRCVIKIEQRSYYGSRLAWLWMKGEWPDAEVDHRDLDKTNDRWSNLRLATHNQNQSNSHLRRHNRSGFKGVSIEIKKTAKPFQAKISVNGKTVYLGHFDTPELAHAAYCAAAEERHKNFFRNK